MLPREMASFFPHPNSATKASNPTRHPQSLYSSDHFLDLLDPLLPAMVLPGAPSASTTQGCSGHPLLASSPAPFYRP